MKGPLAHSRSFSRDERLDAAVAMTGSRICVSSATMARSTIVDRSGQLDVVEQGRCSHDHKEQPLIEEANSVGVV